MFLLTDPRRAARAFMVAAVSTLGVSAQAAVLTEFCIRTSDFDVAGTDDDLYVTLVGVSGEETREFRIDNPGVNDLERARWTCFAAPDNIGRGAIQDVGFHVMAKLRFSGGDDYCMRQMYTRRWRDSVTSDLSTLISTSQFWDPAVDKRVCFGDTPSLGSVWKKTFDTRSRPPAGESLKVSGNWFLVDQHAGPKQTFNLTESLSTARGVTETRAWSLAIERGFEVETNLGGGSATNSLKITATHEESTAISRTSQRTEARSFTKDCYSTDGQAANLAMWQWTVGIPSRFGGESRMQTSATVCTVNAAAAGPRCRPGCFDLNADPSGATCLQNSAACRIMLP
ncbi:PLAT/LH2 domain-containing protein [Pseudoponticoccus marisrubri]|uniref:PLAT domain-containing protein n=1 Tax=Pseudoponticoccus marisrubri TaxID=1685382 RepID=A0A0W7WG58_9RHOB|nr:PLAT/LH2 domain-containing protein [Pseudoponticoccus marisrubri]KUF09470.1 hypothetical protein AVJ23_17670 [Pseudoponticoccus marisrubri]